MSRLSVISQEELWEKTDNGLSVFEQEIEDFSLIKNVKNPFKEERNPSARIKKSSKSGLYLLNIYNDEGGFYNAITFIQHKYNLNYQEAIDYILGKITANPVKKTKKEVKNSTFYYDFEPMPFSKEHTDYYCCGLDEKFLTKEMDIYAVKRYAINKNIKYPKKDEFMFCYEHRNIEGKITNRVKLLTLGKNVEKKDKWRTNCLPYEFFYTHKIKDNKLVFLSKSNKDAAITQKLGITTIAAMSENKWNIAEGLVKLKDVYPNVKFVLNLGSDNQAKETSIWLSKEFKLNWFNTPNRFLQNDINDNFSYVKAFGMESFKKLLIKKGFL